MWVRKLTFKNVNNVIIYEGQLRLNKGKSKVIIR